MTESLTYFKTKSGNLKNFMFLGLIVIELFYAGRLICVKCLNCGGQYRIPKLFDDGFFRQSVPAYLIFNFLYNFDLTVTKECQNSATPPHPSDDCGLKNFTFLDFMFLDPLF